MHGIPLTCPHDALTLRQQANSLVCPNNHQFDLSRDGYVNLLPVLKKTSKDPGDSKRMVTARRKVMDAGVFEKVASTFASDILQHYFNRDESAAHQTVIVDAGCGEGYYTSLLQDKLLHHNKCNRISGAAPAVVGVDISKWAIGAAAKRHKHCYWVVANNKELPLAQGRIDVITSLFGFETWGPWAQLQNNGQLVAVVNAGPRHLIELRSLIYNDVKIHEPDKHVGAAAAGYECIAESSISYSCPVREPGLLESILNMTPHAHRTDADALERVRAVIQLDLEIDTVLRIYQRKGK